MMYSEEHSYLDDGKATGFIKPYRTVTALLRFCRTRIFLSATMLLP